LNKLRKGAATFEQIDAYLSRQSELQGSNFNMSKRQFQRDLKDIESIFEIEIKFDFRKKVYAINEEEQSEISRRRMEAFDTFNALKIGDSTRKSVQFEKRPPQGTEHLFGLLHAIRNEYQIKFTYHKFWEEQPSERNAEPLALKEFRNRWYLVAIDLKDNCTKTFALDRMFDLEITQKRFQIPIDFDVEKQFQHCFGIICPRGEEPQEVILSFDPEQGKYIKTLPLHESQQIIIDNNDELQVKLLLYLTYDFTMELLSYGEKVKVLKPKSLIDEMRNIYSEALQLYK
jgi:predicted DNA-binding transcriptional regulator YafY